MVPFLETRRLLYWLTRKPRPYMDSLPTETVLAYDVSLDSKNDLI